MTTPNPQETTDSPSDPAALAAARTAKRRPVLERCVEKLRENRRQRIARMVPNWTDEELAILEPIAKKLVSREYSYTKACVEGRKVLPDRSWDAIRKKLKNYSGHGVWKP